MFSSRRLPSNPQENNSVPGRQDFPEQSFSTHLGWETRVLFLLLVSIVLQTQTSAKSNRNDFQKTKKEYRQDMQTTSPKFLSLDSTNIKLICQIALKVPKHSSHFLYLPLRGWVANSSRHPSTDCICSCAGPTLSYKPYFSQFAPNSSKVGLFPTTISQSSPSTELINRCPLEHKRVKREFYGVPIKI